MTSNMHFSTNIIRNIRKYGSTRRLTPEEVTRILRSNEYTKDMTHVSDSAVKYYDSNQLAANSPIEDAKAEAHCKLSNGLLFGIFDGHGGNKCAQIIASRLFYYISACLAPQKILQQLKNQQFHDHLLEFLHANVQQYHGDENFSSFVQDLLQKAAQLQMEDLLKHSFIKLDDDLSNEIIRQLEDHDASQSVDASGSVAVVAHISGPDLYVAGVGDCEAVLGTFTEADGWSAKMMSVQHNCDNTDEVKRIWSEHPANERRTVISDNRLLGQLAPLRAFGDYQYKWSKKIIDQVFVPYYGKSSVLPHYHTPPYLTALPQIVHHRLTANDKFLIIASDGLWEFLTPFEAVRLVGEHMSRKIAVGPLKLPLTNMKLSEINKMLLERKEGLKKKPLDENAATHLLRNALGGKECETDHRFIAHYLTLSNTSVRFFRDDITITVIYMNTDFFQNSQL